MKTSTCLLIMAYLSISGLHAQSQASRLVAWTAYINFNVSDSARYTYTNSNGGDLTHLLKYDTETIYAYNPNPPVDSFVTYEDVQETFNTNGYKTDSLTRFWDTTHWVNEWRTLFNYDANNRDTLAYYQTWDSTKWIGALKTYYHYTNNRIDTVTMEDSSDTFGGYVGDVKRSYTYNGAGYITDEVMAYWNVLNKSWSSTANLQFLYYYDSFNNDTAWVVQYYDTTGAGKWVNSYKMVYTYNAHHNPVTSAELMWDTTALDTVSKTTTQYYYDAGFNDTSDVTLAYNYNISKWSTETTNSYTYNGYNQVTYHKSYNADLFLPYSETKYYYEDYIPSGAQQLTVNNNQLSVYPNPTTGLVAISSAKNIDEITVTNFIGQTVLKSPSEDSRVTKQTIDVSTLPDGLYFITVNTTAGTVTQKFVVVKNK